MIADRVVVMKAGRVEQVAPPKDIYCCPASLFVARFIGLNNLIPAMAQSEHDHTRLATDLGVFQIEPASWEGPVTVLIRPDAIHLDGSQPAKLSGRLVEVVFRGSTIRTTLEVKGLELSFDFPSNVRLPAVGDSLQISFDPQQALQIFPDSLD